MQAAEAAKSIRKPTNLSLDSALLDVQSNLLGGLNTRVVVPLLPKSSAPSPAQRLNPVFNIEGQEVVMATQYMAAVPEGELRFGASSLAEQQDEIFCSVRSNFMK